MIKGKEEYLADGWDAKSDGLGIRLVRNGGTPAEQIVYMDQEAIRALVHYAKKWGLDL